MRRSVPVSSKCTAKAWRLSLRRNSRHTKAMHLLQAGVPLVTIKDFLGHADVKSTDVYVQIDLAMKREALTLVGSPASLRSKASRLSEDLLSWLESL